MRTLEQEFAAKVYDKVVGVDAAHPDKDDNLRKRYGAMAQKLPILIHTAGLAQALAFVEAKANGNNKQPYTQLLTDLADVLKFTDGSALSAKSRSVPLPEYIQLTRQVVLALTWFKRFSQSILDVDPTQGD